MHGKSVRNGQQVLVQLAQPFERHAGSGPSGGAGRGDLRRRFDVMLLRIERLEPALQIVDAGGQHGVGPALLDQATRLECLRP